MKSRIDETKGKSFLQSIKRQRSLTDPVGLFLLLGSTLAMLVAALFKAQGLPPKRPRSGVSRR